MGARSSFYRTRCLTSLVVAGAILIHSATYGGVLAKRGFSKGELAQFQQLEQVSQTRTRDIQGGSGDWLFHPRTIFVAVVVIALAAWAADGFETHENECIINGRRIDPNSRECREAANRASRE